jgi:hypothetical protein
MGQLKRIASPFRFQIPDDLVSDLRSLRARQRDWNEVVDSEDVVHLFYGLGPARFLAFDGRVLVDPTDWDGTDPYEVIDPKEAWSAIVVGTDIWSFPPFLRLLPPRPLGAVDCAQCKGTGWISWVDAVGNTGKVVCWDGCGGLGWHKSGNQE